MPRSCSICGHAQTAEITKAIVAGEPFRSIAQRFGVNAVSSQRHAKGCLRVARKAEKTRRDDERTSAGESFRFGSERCEGCGTSLSSTDAEALLKRAERLLWIAETIATKAQADADSRLALQAVDRARAALETMMRATGQIGGDMAVSVTIDQRNQAYAKIARLSEAELRSLARGEILESQVLPASVKDAKIVA